jgi:signal transduction histidine kinase/CheY-like chemotaxis protein
VGNPLLIVAAVVQAVAVVYGLILLKQRKGAAAGWLFLLGAMSSMLTWRVFVVFDVQPPPAFNSIIAIWGSSCMFAAMYFFGREGALRRRAESERDALLTSERAARETAERASRLKDDFLATASHELRTPLSVILSWCTIARSERAGKAETTKAIDVIERNARIQARLVDDLLDVTRMQAGSLSLELRPVSLDGPVRAALNSVAPAAADKNIAIAFEAPATPPVVSGDASRLQQIAGNLLTNAIKFTPPGGRVHVSIESAMDRARIVVRDDGEGISANFLPKLFGRFQQADTSTTRRHSGLGLGLSIVANLARLHGGSASATSAGPGQGATFVVELPVASRRAADPEPTHPSEPANLAGIRVLLLDDEADVRDSTSTLLRQFGAEVHAIASPRAVLDEIGRFSPHVIILDIGMPEEDGYSVMRRVREHSREIPAVSLTAHARAEDRARALEAGFADHLSKPIDVGRLTVAIRRLADRGR